MENLQLQFLNNSNGSSVEDLFLEMANTDEGSVVTAIENYPASKVKTHRSNPLLFQKGSSDIQKLSRFLSY